MSTPGQTPHELRKEIDATRRELGATVEALAAKTAVKARLHDRVEHVKDALKRPVLAAVIAGAAIVLTVGLTLSRRTT
jgi:Protein of unknown function (DUF3618)